jgi:hypothetical protein
MDGTCSSLWTLAAVVNAFCQPCILVLGLPSKIAEDQNVLKCEFTSVFVVTFSSIKY